LKAVSDLMRAESAFGKNVIQSASNDQATALAASLKIIPVYEVCNPGVPEMLSELC
jgi:hypothetical protein